MADIERALTFIESMRLGVDLNPFIPHDQKSAILADLDILATMLKGEA